MTRKSAEVVQAPRGTHRTLHRKFSTPLGARGRRADPCPPDTSADLPVHGRRSVASRTASLLSEHGEKVDGLREEDLRLLGLLAGGATDEVAARNLGISRRSVTRSVERLMAATGSTSRFELALNAARAGWL